MENVMKITFDVKQESWKIILESMLQSKHLEIGPIHFHPFFFQI